MTNFDTRRTIMVDTQVRPSDVTKFPIIAAMLELPREAFVPDGLRDLAYAGENIHLGGGRVMLEPRTLSKMLDAVDIQPDELVLDLGCGFGYSTAVAARLAEAVIGVEDDPDRASEAQRTLSAQNIDNAAVLLKESLGHGCAEQKPYDVILIQGGVEIMPEAVVSQLKEGGRIGAVFNDGALGVVRVGYMLDGAVTWRDSFNAGAPTIVGFEAAQTFKL